MRVLSALFVTLLLSLSAMGQDDPYGIIDTVRVESVSASPGDRIDVPIYLVNDEALRGLTVPMKFEQHVLTLDTVSFEGSRIDYLSAKFSPIDNSEGTVIIAGVVISEDTIPADAKADLSWAAIGDQLLRTLVDKRTPAGYHEVTWDGRNQSDRAAASGVYFYRLETQDFSKTRKMMLIK